MRRLALIATLVIAAAAWVAASAGAGDSHTYKIEMYNAFGIVKGSDVRVAGVNSGSVTDLGITPEKRALVTIQLSGPLSVLGTDTRCSSEPQSLIAEYFIDCSPKGPPLPDGGTIPASHVTQTVQSDLVQNTLREPFAQRLQLLINEFGTALAGNPKDLNQAIRLGAPALRNLKQALDILAEQNATIRDLNANSDKIISQLAANKADVVRFIQRARDTAAASAARSSDLSQNFHLLDSFLAELRPTLAKLGDVAQQQTPLLSDLRTAAPDLNRLAVNLPAFNQATDRSLTSLGQASGPGITAFRHGIDDVQALKASGQNAYSAVDALDKFLLDISTPKRHVETDARAADSCDPSVQHPKTRPCYSTGRKAPTGYSGMEGLLNYVYYQAGAINQFDLFGHLLHFSLFDVGASPCGSYSAADTLPKKGGGTTTDVTQADPCVSVLGANQPGINQEPGINDISPYDPSVCPDGSSDLQLCNPAGSKRKAAATASAGTGGGGAAGGPGQAGAPGTSPLPQVPNAPLPGANNLQGGLDNLLGLGGHHHNGGGGGGGLLGTGVGGGGGGSTSGGSGSATEDLLNFLFGN